MDKVKKLGACLAFVLVSYSIIMLMDQVMERKYSYSKYADFYEQEEDFDVLFFGTSHMLNAVYPMELWNDYGIVSYNMANSSETLCVNYWQLVNALEYTTPKLVVVDLYAIDGGSKVNGSFLHNFSDTMPLSLLKLRMVTDLLPMESWPEYLFELSLYHSRWDELGKEDFFPPKMVEKGAELRGDVTVDVPPTIIPQETYIDNNHVGKGYLIKMIELCKKNNIDIVLTYVPYSAPESHQEVANTGYVIAEEYDIPYLNFFYEDMEFNYTTDCADIGSHINASGARKVTDYFGKYIIENYDIPDRRNDSKYESWNEDYQEYMELKLQTLQYYGDELMSYLTLLNDRTLETTIFLTEDSLVYQDNDIMEFLDNISVFGNLTYEFLPDNYYEGNIMLKVVDKRTQQVVSEENFTRVEQNVYSSY